MMGDSGKVEPPKPTEPSFGGFAGSLVAESAIVRDFGRQSIHLLRLAEWGADVLIPTPSDSPHNGLAGVRPSVLTHWRRVAPIAHPGELLPPTSLLRVYLSRSTLFGTHPDKKRSHPTQLCVS
jgi:hypothetical protein